MQEAAAAAKAASDAARAVDAGIKKMWTILDAASEKQSPAKVLDPKAIQAIQGTTTPQS